MKLLIGENIKRLRTQKGITQEALAGYMHVSTAAVSKWERNETLPDVTLIPPLASYFGVTTDELLNYNLYEIEKEIEYIVKEHCKYRDIDNAKAEQIIRDGLEKYPGNDILLNCLICVLDMTEQSDEIIETARRLIDITKQYEVKFDAYRIMAEAYVSQGKYAQARQAVENIPELYFTKLELIATLFDGEESYEAAQKQKNISAEKLINMLIIAGKYLKKSGETEKANAQFRIAQKIINAFANDFIEDRWFWATIYECTTEQQKEIEQLLCE